MPQIQEIREIQVHDQWFYPLTLGVLVIGIFIGIGLMTFADKDSYGMNLFTESLGIGITVLFVDRLRVYRDRASLKRRLIREVANGTHDVAIRAVIELEHERSLKGDNGLLKSKNLDDAKLAGAELECANLEGASLRDAELCEANLYGANLNDAVLHHADMSGANLENAVLTADLRSAIMKDAILIGADLGLANLSHVDLEDAELMEANMQDAWLDGTKSTWSYNDKR